LFELPYFAIGISELSPNKHGMLVDQRVSFCAMFCAEKH